MRAAGRSAAHWCPARGLQSAWSSQPRPGQAHIWLGWAWLLTEHGPALPSGSSFVPRALGRPDKAQGALPSRAPHRTSRGGRRRGRLATRSAGVMVGKGAEGRSAQGPAVTPLGCLPRSEGLIAQHLCESGSAFCPPHPPPCCSGSLRALSEEGTPSGQKASEVAPVLEGEAHDGRESLGALFLPQRWAGLFLPLGPQASRQCGQVNCSPPCPPHGLRGDCRPNWQGSPRNWQR